MIEQLKVLDVGATYKESEALTYEFARPSFAELHNSMYKASNQHCMMLGNALQDVRLVTEDDEDATAQRPQRRRFEITSTLHTRMQTNSRMEVLIEISVTRVR